MTRFAEVSQTQLQLTLEISEQSKLQKLLIFVISILRNQLIHSMDQNSHSRFQNAGSTTLSPLSRHKSNYLTTQGSKVDSLFLKPEPYKKSSASTDSLKNFQDELLLAVGQNKKKKAKKPKHDFSTTNLFNLNSNHRRTSASNDGQSQINQLEDRLDRLIEESNSFKMRQANLLGGANCMYPYDARYPFQPHGMQNYWQPQLAPYPMHPPYGYPEAPRGASRQQPQSYQDRRASTRTQDIKSARRANQNIQRLRINHKRFKKVFLCVFFSFLLRKQARTISNFRRMQSDRFFRESFDTQIRGLKNWLIESHQDFLAIILEKKDLDFDFRMEKSPKVRKTQIDSIICIIETGLVGLEATTLTHRLFPFIGLITYLCKKGSFPKPGFWVAQELEQISLSEVFGCFRVDSSQQKCLIVLVVIIKVLLYNLVLQPYKFDPENFPKADTRLMANMKVIGSAYYLLAKDLIKGLLSEKRDQQLDQAGNWLRVSRQLVVECSEPLTYGRVYPEEGEYISGLLKGFEMQEVVAHEGWGRCLRRMEAIVRKVHSEMGVKNKMERRVSRQKAVL